jgi:energy-coupling factor transporter ATP-binding protein EcfA2
VRSVADERETMTDEQAEKLLKLVTQLDAAVVVLTHQMDQLLEMARRLGMKQGLAVPGPTAATTPPARQ